MSKINFTKYQLGAMVALPLSIMLNPLTVELFLEFIKNVFAVISVVCAVYFILFTLVQVFRPQRVNIPAKGKATKKAGAFIAT